jgi:hypothetical protein
MIVQEGHAHLSDWSADRDARDAAEVDAALAILGCEVQTA